jgi:5-methylthioadenosine/S-adenosylhomocysteine deaminase
VSGMQEKSCLIDNIQLLTPGENASFSLNETRSALLVTDGRIVAIAQNSSDRSGLAARAHNVVDAGGKVAMPGLVNSHCHSYASVLRGTENSQPLEVWALYTMAYGCSLTPDLIHSAVHLSAAEMIRNGITAVIDHIPHIGLFDHALAAHEQTGMRVGLAPFMQDIPDHQFLKFDLPDDLRIPLETPTPMTPAQTNSFFESVFEQLIDLPDRLIGMIGPNAPQRCSPSLWQVWRELQEKFDAQVHTHLLETSIQAEQSHKTWSGGLVAEMARQGLLNNKLSTAHNIWLADTERDLLADHGVTVVHNPASNLMLGSGVMPYSDYRDRDMAIGLGSDSANTAGRHDIFEAARLASMLPRLETRDDQSWPSTADVLSGSICAGATALGLGQDMGRLAVGQIADLILLNMDKSVSAGPHLNPELVAQHGCRDVVTDVMIDGRWVMRHGELQTIDEATVLTDFAGQRGDLLARAGAQSDDMIRTADLIREKLLS